MFFCYRVKVKEREADPMTEVESACFHGNQYLVWGYRCYFLSWINSHLSNTDKLNSFHVKTTFLYKPCGFLRYRKYKLFVTYNYNYKSNCNKIEKEVHGNRFEYKNKILI